MGASARTSHAGLRIWANYRARKSANGRGRCYDFAMGHRLTVDVVSDIICPWCFIGKRRLERAAAILGGAIEIRWHPFQLNPGMPIEGISRREYRTAKFGSWEYSRQLDARVAENGRQAGIEFRHDLMERTPNSFRGHVLICLLYTSRCV